MHKPEKEQTGNLEEQDIPMILKDPELAKLALYLHQNPPPLVEPAYREALQSKLLDIVRTQRQRQDCDEAGVVETESETNSEQIILEIDTRKPIEELDDPELETLACHLQQTSPVVSIGPKFQEALQEKLLEVVRSPVGTVSKKKLQNILSLKLSCLI